MNPYNNNNTFHPLLKEELLQLDNVWNFIYEFNIPTLRKRKYREKITKKIQKLYLPQEFLMFENIVEKIYWNLFNVISAKLQISNLARICHNKKHNHKITLMTDTLIDKSSIRKSYINESNNNIYKSNYPNDIDLLIFSIMLNRSTYETIMSHDLSLYDINSLVPNPNNSTIEFDYPFPNLNTILPFSHSTSEKIKNIYKMYYAQDSVSNWIN